MYDEIKMHPIISTQITDTINCGIIVIDNCFKVSYWNRWMEIHSGIEASKAIDSNLLDLFSNLNNQQFIRNCKSIFSFGNYIFISQKLHQNLFPFKPVSSLSSNLEFMQQSCALFPLRDENNVITNICITIYDVTELVLYQIKLLNMSRTDILTGIYNRRYLEDRLKEEWERHKRHNRELSLIIFDIDLFKVINDTYGHYYGDMAIKFVADTAKETLRDIDIIGRYGGEEFCCVLPDTNDTAALYVAERIRSNIEKNVLKIGSKTISLTISAGVAQMNEHMKEPEELIKLADCGLYKAKNAGRNKTVLEK